MKDEREKVSGRVTTLGVKKKQWRSPRLNTLAVSETANKKKYPGSESVNGDMALMTS